VNDEAKAPTPPSPPPWGTLVTLGQVGGVRGIVIAVGSEEDLRRLSELMYMLVEIRPKGEKP
jgi:hypothetical protein